MVTLDSHAFTAVTVRINAILTRMQGHRLLHIIGEKVKEQTERHFEREAGPAGAWAPLQPSTLARKRGRKILTETGTLRGSVAMDVGAGSVEVGTNVPYGKYHQFGTRRMVARPWLGLTNDDKTELEHTITAFMHSVLR